MYLLPFTPCPENSKCCLPVRHSCCRDLSGSSHVPEAVLAPGILRPCPPGAAGRPRTRPQSAVPQWDPMPAEVQGAGSRGPRSLQERWPCQPRGRPSLPSHIDVGPHVMMSKTSSFPSHFREEIQILTKKYQELEEIRREERDHPVERSPEVWLSWVSDFLHGCHRALSQGWTVLGGPSPGSPDSDADSPVPLCRPHRSPQSACVESRALN